MFKSWRIAFLLTMLAMLSILISACGEAAAPATTGSAPAATPTPKGPACVSGTITIDGSSALKPLADDVSNNYQDACSGATITIKGNGSGAGLSGAQDGSIAIGNSDIFADKTKQPDVVDHQVAVVVFSVVVNGDVTGVKDLKSQQISDIFSGKITNWKDVGGPDLQIITAYRKPNSGTRVTFDKYVMQAGAQEKTDSASVNADSSSDLAAVVKNTKGAISYVASSFAQKNTLTVVTIDGVADSEANVKTNTYKFWNVEHMYTKAAATGLAKSFIDYMASDSAAVVAARQKDGFIALSAMSKTALDAKQPTA